MKIMHPSYTILPDLPKDINKILSDNKKQIQERYSPETLDPLPIYIISGHGIIKQGVQITANLMNYSITSGGENEPDGYYGHNFFRPPKDTYILHTSPLGTDCISDYKNDNSILYRLLHKKRTRDNPSTEENYVSFARDVFNDNIKNWIEMKPIENLCYSQIIMFNELVDEICDNIYKDTKSYNLRRKNHKIRKNRKPFKSRYRIDVSKYSDKYVLRKTHQIIRTIKRSKFTDYEEYIEKINILYDQIVTSNISFKKVKYNSPLIGCAQLPTIEKYITFKDAPLYSDEYNRWKMGIIEISEHTQKYLNQNKVNLCNRTHNLPKRTIYDLKSRILNNNYQGILSGNCIHSKHLTKTQWLTQRINETLEHKEAKPIALSEIISEFGEGIYIVQNCSPLTIWNGNIKRQSLRKCPNANLNAPISIKNGFSTYIQKCLGSFGIPKDHTEVLKYI